MTRRRRKWREKTPTPSYVQRSAQGTSTPAELSEVMLSEADIIIHGSSDPDMDWVARTTPAWFTGSSRGIAVWVLGSRKLTYACELSFEIFQYTSN